MKVKAVIFYPDRMNRSVKVKSKMKTGETFAHDGKQYSIDSDNFVITGKRFLGIKINYITFYYRYDNPKPLPAPLFPDIKTIGISPEELNKIFSPVFYNLIASGTKNKKVDMLVYMMLGVILGIIYIGFTLHNMPHDIALQIQEALKQQAQKVASTPPSHGV